MMRPYHLVAVLVMGLLFSGMAYGTETVDPALCRAAIASTPSPDVDYKPGVDVHGHYVAPADVDASSSNPISKVAIPLTVPLAKLLNVNPNQYPYNQFGSQTEAVLGVLSIDGNKVTLNGQPLSNDQQSKLLVLCAQHNKQ
jgi:hypothetical protein